MEAVAAVVVATRECSLRGCQQWDTYGRDDGLLKHHRPLWCSVYLVPYWTCRGSYERGGHGTHHASRRLVRRRTRQRS